MKVRGYMFNRVLKMQQESFISKMQDIPRRLSGRARSVITKKGLERKPFFKGLCRSLLGLTVYRMRLAILHMQNYWAITRLGVIQFTRPPNLNDHFFYPILATP
jgi:hypothetical protein